jgi:hypothetical protein
MNTRLGIAAVTDTRGRVRATTKQVVHVRQGNHKLCGLNRTPPSWWLDAPAGAVVTCGECKKRMRTSAGTQ